MKRFQGDLILSTLVFGANTRARGVAIPASSAYLFPSEWYPLDHSTQISLLWKLDTLPTGASYVDLTPFTFEGIDLDLVGNTTVDLTGGTEVNSLNRYLWQFDELDSTNNRVLPHPYTIHRTVIDAGVYGRRYGLPICPGEYVGFLVVHDGTTNTGIHTLSAVIATA